MRKIWERRDEISFSHNITTVIAQQQSQSNSSMLYNNDEQHEASEGEGEIEIEEIAGEIEEGAGKVKKSKAEFFGQEMRCYASLSSWCRRGQFLVVPVGQ